MLARQGPVGRKHSLAAVILVIITAATASSRPQSFRNGRFLSQILLASLSFVYSVPLSLRRPASVLLPVQVANLCSVLDASLCCVLCNWELLLAPIEFTLEPT